MRVDLELNGVKRSLELEPADILLNVLRREGLRGIKSGCEDGSCGNCTILIDGVPRKACLTFAGQVQGRSVTTIEGLGTPSEPHPLQKAFVEKAAVQCGFCTPAMILSAKSLLDRNSNPSDEEIKSALDGVLCRCTGYVQIIEAVRLAADGEGKES